MLKMVDIEALIASLRRAGMEAGLCLEGGSSYPLVRLAGGMELYGYVPDPNFQEQPEEDLIAQELLDSLAANQEETG
jgi:hypothetical protein